MTIIIIDLHNVIMTELCATEARDVLAWIQNLIMLVTPSRRSERSAVGPCHYGLVLTAAHNGSRIC